MNEEFRELHCLGQFRMDISDCFHVSMSLTLILLFLKPTVFFLLNVMAQHWLVIKEGQFSLILNLSAQIIVKVV